MTKPGLNSLYSFLSYGLARYGNTTVMPPLPVAISVEISAVCNLTCPECVAGTGSLARNSRFIDLSFAEQIAGEMRGLVNSTYLYYQGEPMMHPQFFDIVRLFRGMNPVISTNGHFLDNETCEMLACSDLKRIIISYDGVTPATYSTYRKGGDHEKVTRGIMLLADTLKKRNSALKIQLHFLLGRHNEHEAKAAASFARSVNAGFRVKSMQVLDISRVAIWMPSQKRKSRYEFEEGHYRPFPSKSRGCTRMWSGSVITVDGDVIPCCYDKNAVYTMGNLKSQNFRDIWKGDRYQEFRSTVIAGRSNIDMCADCPQGRRLFFRN